MKRVFGILCVMFTAVAFAAEGEEVAMISSEGMAPVYNDASPMRNRLEDIASHLKFSGDVRTNVSNASEFKNGNQIRGAGGINPSTKYDNVKVNLKLDYKTPRLWSSSHLKVDTKVAQELKERVVLEKFVVGGRVFDGDVTRVDTEVGHRRLVSAFESKLQFASMTENALFKVAVPSLGNAYVTGAAFIREFSADPHVAFAVETGVLNIAKSGAFAKYSFIDWDTKTYSNPREQSKYKYANSQILIGHKSAPSWLAKTPVKVYAAGLLNHKATPTAYSKNTLANFGFYSGVTLGKAAKRGDWLVDGHYQVLAAQAVPMFDALGLRRGNHKGVAVRGNYMITDTLSVNASVHHASNWKKGIGPTTNINLGKVEVVLAF